MGLAYLLDDLIDKLSSGHGTAAIDKTFVSLVLSFSLNHRVVHLGNCLASLTLSDVLGSWTAPLTFFFVKFLDSDLNSKFLQLLQSIQALGQQAMILASTMFHSWNTVLLLSGAFLPPSKQFKSSDCRISSTSVVEHPADVIWSIL